MKSQLDMLFLIAASIIKDATLSCAYQDREASRDISRLSKSVETRGLTVFVLDLPSCDKALLSGLEESVLKPSGFACKRRSKDDLRPAFLHRLWSLVFDKTGCLIEDPCPNAILFLRQIFCLGKKIVVECSPARLEAAVKNYHDIERELPCPILRWDEDELDHSGKNLDYAYSPDFDSSSNGDGSMFHAPQAKLYNELSDRAAWSNRVLDALRFTTRALTATLGSFDSLGANDSRGGRFRHGPGAVVDKRRETYKYLFPNWPRKLGNTFPFEWCGSSTMEVEEFPSEHEPPSRLTAVPKTAKAPRLIAVEPLAHQWCQQKVASWLTRAIDRTIAGKFIDLGNQTLSQEMVREASIHRHLATLDLSDASDRLSCRHVEFMLRGNIPLLEAVHAVRTRWLKDRVIRTKDTKFLRLKKFAAQGNALTFPMQSLFFLACALAACEVRSFRDMEALIGKVRVFGDDIIVPAYAYEPLKVLLTRLGLKVNDDKSFVKGHFRESCGVDSWRGYDITPLKPKTLLADTPESKQSLIDTANNFFKKGLWYAAEVLDSTLLEEGIKLPVAHVSTGVPALLSFTGFSLNGLRTRFNEDLQRWEVLVPGIIKPVSRVRQDNSGALLQYFTEEPTPMITWRKSVTSWSSGVPRERVATFAARWVDRALYLKAGERPA